MGENGGEDWDGQDWLGARPCMLLCVLFGVVCVVAVHRHQLPIVIIIIIIIIISCVCCFHLLVGCVLIVRCLLVYL